MRKAFLFRGHSGRRRVTRAVVAVAVIVVLAGIGTGAYLLVRGEAPSGPSRFPVKVDDKWGYIDKTGSIRISPRFEHAADFSEGLAAVESGDYWGYIDEAGVVVINPQFPSRPGEFHDGRAKVAAQGGTYGYIGTDGAWVVQPQFADAEDVSEGFAAVEERPGSWGYIRTNGDWLARPQFDSAQPFSEGLARVSGGSVIDRSGRPVWDSQFAVGKSFHEGLAAAVDSTGARSGFIDKNARWVVTLPEGSRPFDSFSEGLASVQTQVNGLAACGYVDKHGTWVIQPRPGMAFMFSEGLAVLAVADANATYGLWGYIDKKGATIVEPRYAWAEAFSGGVARVYTTYPATITEETTRDLSPTYLDRTGKVIWQGK